MNLGSLQQMFDLRFGEVGWDGGEKKKEPWKYLGKYTQSDLNDP